MSAQPEWNEQPNQPPPPPTGGGPASDALAGFWIRFAGALIDGILLGIVSGILSGILGDITGILGIAIAGGYFTYLHSTKAGQTLGQRVVGIRLVDQRSGGQVEVGSALVRWAMSYVSGIALAIGYLWMLWDPNNQTWHDKVANTLVVKSAVYPPPSQSLFDR